MKTTYFKFAAAIAGLVLVLGSVGGYMHLAYSQTPSPKDEAEPTATREEEEDVDGDVQLLKEKIATKVAELSDENRKAFAGYVVQIEEDSVTIATDEDREIVVTTEEGATEVFSLLSGENTTVGINEIGEGDYITAFGVFLDDILNSNIIYIQEQTVVGVGTITELDDSAFTVDISTREKDQITLDIERSTAQSIVEDSALSQAGFGDFEIGDTVHFVYTLDSQEDERVRFSAASTLIVPQELTRTAEEETEQESTDEQETQKEAEDSQE